MKKDLVDLLVNQFNWKRSDAEKLTIESLEIQYKKEMMLQAFEAQLATETKETTKPSEEKRVVAEKKFHDDDQIEVMNGAPSVLFYKGLRDEFLYEFKNYGEVQTMSFAELRMMSRRNRKYLEENWIIIMDEEVLKELRLDHLQQEYYTDEDLFEMLSEDSLFRLSEALESKDSIQQAIIRKAIAMNNSGELRLVSIKKKIEDHFKLDLDEIILEKD